LIPTILIGSIRSGMIHSYSRCSRSEEKNSSKLSKNDVSHQIPSYSKNELEWCLWRITSKPDM
jgi:hypothetical protein